MLFPEVPKLSLGLPLFLDFNSNHLPVFADIHNLRQLACLD